MRKPRITPTVNTLSIPRRILGSALDAIFCIAIMALLYGVLGYPVILQNNGYNETTAERKVFINAPQLLNLSEDGKYSYIEYKDYDENIDEYGYQRYETMTWQYFTVYLPNHEDYEYAPSGFGKTQGNKLTPFDDSKRLNASYVGQWTFENFFEGEYYEAAKDEQGNMDYTRTPVLKESAKEKGTDGKLIYARALRSFFNSYDTEKGAYIEAAHNLIAQPKIKTYDNAISNKQWQATIPSIALAPIIFYFLLPVLLPNGRSVGKLIVRGAVLNEQGFTANKAQIALRQVIPLALWYVLLIPMVYVGVMAFLFLIALLYIFVVMSPVGQGLGDRLAKTVVINAKTSIWFRTQKDLEDYIENHPSSLVAKANKNEKEDHTYAPTKEEYGIFDSSMIGQARKTAETIESFDEFEAREEKVEPPVEPMEKKEEPSPVEAKEEIAPATSIDEDEEKFTDDDTPR